MRRLVRRPVRRPSRLFVTYWPPGREDEYREGRVTNVSSSGLFIESPDPVPPPTVLNLRFVLDDEDVDLGGEVVRSVGGRLHQRTASGMGVRFQDPEAVGIDRLLRYSNPL